MTDPFLPTVILGNLLSKHYNPDVPHASVAALVDGHIYSATQGCAADTIFQAASISKTVAAITALILVEKGQLDLDEDINDKLTSWKLPAPGAHRTKVTLKQLLCHAGALNVRSFPGYATHDVIPKLSEILDGHPRSKTTGVRIVGIPGLTSNYSGGGYAIVQQLIEDVTHKTFGAVVAELVFAPLDMATATFTTPPADRIVTARANGHDVPGRFRLYPELACAGMWCTPTDLVKLAMGGQAAIAGKDGAILGRRLAGDLVTSWFPGTGLGVDLAGSGPGRLFGHGGANEGYVCEFSATEIPGSAVAVMTASDLGDEVIQPMLPAIRDEFKWPKSTTKIAQMAAGDPQPSTSNLDSEIKAYLGHYLTAEGVKLQLTGHAWNWSLAVGDQPALPLQPTSETRARSHVGGVAVDFSFDSSNKVDQLTLHQWGESVTAVRQHS